MLFCEAHPARKPGTDNRVVHVLGDPEELTKYAKSIGCFDWWVKWTKHRVPYYELTGKRMFRVMTDEKVEKLERGPFVEAYRLLLRAIRKANEHSVSGIPVSLPPDVAESRSRRPGAMATNHREPTPRPVQTARATRRQEGPQGKTGG